MTPDPDLAAGPLYALPERVLTRAQALCGGGGAALYLTDVEGACLLRLAGDGPWPERLDVRGAVGPELDAAATRALCADLRARWPTAGVEPLWVLGRALGVLVTARPADGLAALARSGAALFELASGYTDVFERGRRTTQPSPAAEMQLELLPPRIAAVTGGRLVASVLPAYDVGGDWFDHAENPGGVWLAVGDAMGKGIQAAAMSAVSIGALRAARREQAGPAECAAEMHRAISDLGTNGFVTAVVGLWEPRSLRLTWTNCGHLGPLLVRDGTVTELRGETTYPLGLLAYDRVVPSATVALRSGDRLLLYSDGIVEARGPGGTRFGAERLRRLLVETAGQPPAAAVSALEHAVREATDGHLRDDATQLLLAVD